MIIKEEEMTDTHPQHFDLCEDLACLLFLLYLFFDKPL